LFAKTYRSKNDFGKIGVFSTSAKNLALINWRLYFLFEIEII
jgi:hypothetical protein